MPDEQHILDLVEEVLYGDRTPEDVCANAPDLLSQVKEYVHQCRSVHDQVEALFPSASLKSSISRRPFLAQTEIPQIPGYKVESILGRGGMGVVYKATHLKLHRSVALKMLLAGDFASPHELARFMREAEAVASLRHAHIVQVYDVGEFEGRPYFTMEFVEGGNLAQKLAGAQQPISEAAALLRALADAVDAAHRAGIVHRDLKPSNILLTSDGTPKITDFGLARRLEGDPALTRSCARVGTPSYMSPEQARGTAGAFCPCVDIYSLGAILYESLTGRPPFQADTAAETERQLIFEEPVPPSRLNAKVPRDLNTICLKCLAKDPLHRYGTARELADDLLHFSRGEPITARPIGHLERLIKWSRRRPVWAAAIPIAILAVVLSITALLQFRSRQVEIRRAVQHDLAELVALQSHDQWTEAQTLLNHARSLVDEFDAADLRSQLDQAQADVSMGQKLDGIRISRITSWGLNYYRDKANHDYQRLFEQSGIAKPDDSVKEVAARIRTSKIRDALASALDNWAVACIDTHQRSWLLSLALEIDPHRSAWRKHLCDSQTWSDRAALEKLADTTPVADDSLSGLLALTEYIRLAGGDALPLLRRLQRAHPEDFWANLMLGNAILYKAPDEAGVYYYAALAARPREAVASNAVGESLRLQHRPDDAVDYYRRALALDEHCVSAENSLGNALREEGRVAEAIDCYQTALRMDSHYSWAHFDLANYLRQFGRTREAMVHYKALLAQEPDNMVAWVAYFGLQVAQGSGDEALRSWSALAHQWPPNFDRYAGYAELCLYLGHEKDYLETRSEMLKTFHSTANPFTAEPLARACLLRPASPEELRQAQTLADLAVASRKTVSPTVYPYFLFVKGLAEYRQDHFDEAVFFMRGDAGTVMGPCPQLVIAMSQYRSGREADARKTLAIAVTEFDWNPAKADYRDFWIYHILRREAENMILPNLPAFLEGKYQPRENDERLALLGICRSKNLAYASARLYQDAFAEDPHLTSLRYSAACAAALVGCGRSADCTQLGEADRTQWREQARQWLQADLDFKVANAAGSPAAVGERIENELASWQTDSDLVGLREPDELQKLPPAERERFLAFWRVVDAEIKNIKSMN